MLTVALNHARVPGMGGGYIGVDVFFVISGFLITGWLLRRAERRGRVPFGDFYAARARRILPAAGLTLVVAAIASYYFLNFVRALSELRDTYWAAIFAANYHFAQVGTDYFARDNPQSPIQNFWTLAVEEQFYIVWPALLALALFVLRRGSRRRGAIDQTTRRRLLVVVAAGTLASLAWSTHSTPIDPTGAYFSTLTRAWELGVGVLIAVCVADLARLPAAIRAPLSWFGIAAILTAAVAYSSGTAFPGYAAMLPVLGAAAVIIGGLGQPARRGAGLVLNRRPMQVVGDTSYAFYLWHWPFLVIAAQYEGHTLSVPTNLLLLAVAFAVSVATFRLYENPLRHAELLQPASSAIGVWVMNVSVVVIVAASLIVAINARPVQALPAAFAAPPPKPAATPSHHVGHKGHNQPSPDRWMTIVDASATPAREQIHVPQSGLEPSFTDLGTDYYHLGSCQAEAVAATNSAICHMGDTSTGRTMVVIGDSHAQMWLLPLIHFATTYHWNLVPLIKQGCDSTNLGRSSYCQSWFAWAQSQLPALHPSLIVLGLKYSQQALAGGDYQTNAEAGVRRAASALRKFTPRLVVPEDAPYITKNPLDCLLAHGATLGSCTFNQGRELAGLNTYFALAVKSAHGRFLPTLQWFCAANGACPSVIGARIAYYDQGHVSSTYASALDTPIARELHALITQ